MSILTFSYKANLIDRLIDDIADTANNDVHYYIGLSGVVEFDDDNNPPTETQNYDNSYYKLHRELILGKKVLSDNIKKVIPRYDWSSGTIYDMYDDANNSYVSNTSGFYAYNSAGHVYKCLDNGRNPGANGVPSTIEPTGTANVSFETADGYKWKYMYTIDSLTNTNFVTSEFIVAEQNANVLATAIDGALETIVVTSNGVNYSAYGNGQIGSITNSTVFAATFATQTVATSANGSFVGSAILFEGAGAQTSIREITAYNGATKTITIDSAVDDLAQITEITIAPKVTITGDGSGAQAFATINAAANIVSDIVVYDVGSGYSVANATVSCNNNFRVVDATARPIISPPGGHGANTFVELGVERFEIVKDFQGDETGTLATGMNFRTVCLLKDPLDRDLTTKFDENKFNQLIQFTTANLVATDTSFTQGDLVFTETANGVVAFANSTTMYVANVQGDFEFNQTLNPASLGGSSSAEEPDGKFRINSAITNEDLERYSGQVLYYQNLLPSLRSDDQTENFRLIIKV